MLLALAIAWLVAQSQAPSSSIPHFSEITISVAIVGLLGLFWKVQRSYGQGLERQLAECRAEGRLTNWRMGEMQTAMWKKGIVIDEIRWNPPHLVKRDGTLVLDPKDMEEED